MKKLLAVMMVLAIAGSASAATVEYWIETDGSNFDIYCQITEYDADIKGLSLCKAEVSDNIDDCTNMLPIVKAFGAFSKAGFTVLRSADDDPEIAAGQDTLGSIPTDVLAGFGLYEVDMTALYVDGTPMGYTYTFIPASGTAAQPLLVGSGTYSGTAPTLVDVSAYVIDDDSVSGYSTADAVIVPEPITIGLIGVGAMGLLLRRRRR